MGERGEGENDEPQRVREPGRRRLVQLTRGTEGEGAKEVTIEVRSRPEEGRRCEDGADDWNRRGPVEDEAHEERGSRDCLPQSRLPRIHHPGVHSVHPSTCRRTFDVME